MPGRDITKAYQEALGFLPSDAEAQAAYQIAQERSRAGLQDYYNRIGQDISSQFSPQFTQARNFLAGNPLLGDSGYANRLNRQLMSGAFNTLSSQYGRGANELQSGNIDLLRNLLAERQRARAGLAGSYFEARVRPKQKKPGVGPLLGQALGTGIGFLAGGPPGAAAGGAAGRSIGGGGYSNMGVGYAPNDWTYGY